MMADAAAFDRIFAHVAADEAVVLKRLDRLARVMDSAFRIPFVGTRVGADALLNVIPGAGVVFAKSLSAYLIWEAHRLEVPRHVLARMIGNLAVDFAISIVPVAGWIGDVFFRANLRNMALLREHLETRRSNAMLGGPVIDGEVVRRTAR